MGIARRKAGTVVRCPNCAGQVVVPNEEEAQESSPQSAEEPAGDGGAPLFERQDFDDVFHSATGGKPPSPTALPTSPVPPPSPLVPPPARQMNQDDFDVERVDFPGNVPRLKHAQGLTLSPALATLLSVAAVIALALAFLAGLFVGRFLLQPAPREERPPKSKSAAVGVPQEIKDLILTSFPEEDPLIH